MTVDSDLRLAIENEARRLAGNGPIHKQIMLLKLTELVAHKPEFTDTGLIPAESPQRRWLSSVGALLKRIDPVFAGTAFTTNMRNIHQYRTHSVNEITGQVIDAIEELKLELELNGRSEIGSAYEAGEFYRYYSDLKEIIASATKTVFIIDPYFNGEAFHAYVSAITRSIDVRILGMKYTNDIATYAAKHAQQFGTQIEVKKSKELHDRLIVIDDSDCWVTGGSVKQAGEKATYLLPLPPGVAEATRSIYSKIWSEATAI